MTNFNLQKRDETDLKEYLPNIYTKYLKQNWSTSCHGQRARPFKARLQSAMIVSLSVIALQIMYIILSQDAKSSLRLQCDIAGNASEVAILSYTMAGLQHGSKHAEVWRPCPCPHENRIRINDLLSASALLFVSEITKNALSLRITVLVELRLCLLICSTERKTGLQQHHVKMCKYGIWMICSIPYIKSSIPFHTWAIPYRFFSFHSMP